MSPGNAASVHPLARGLVLLAVLLLAADHVLLSRQIEPSSGVPATALAWAAVLTAVTWLVAPWASPRRAGPTPAAPMSAPLRPEPQAPVARFAPASRADADDLRAASDLRLALAGGALLLSVADASLAVASPRVPSLRARARDVERVRSALRLGAGLALVAHRALGRPGAAALSSRTWRLPAAARAGGRPHVR